MEFSQIPALREVVGLDCSLCPPVLDNFIEEDFEFFSEEFGCGTFNDLEHLIGRLEGLEPCNVLAIIRDPSEHIGRIMEPGFCFAGYELLDDDSGISALTNCGGFPAAFSNEELNEVGLISDFQRAREVQCALGEYYPHEPHAQTTVYAIWRRDEYASVPLSG